MTSRAEKIVTQSVEKSISPNEFSTWVKQHKIACFDALNRMINTPLSSLLTIFVVAIALSLPTALQIVIKNLEAGQNSINEQAKITLYLQKNTNKDEIKSLVTQLKSNKALLEVEVIAADQALQQFQFNAKLGNMLDSLKLNPLPTTLILTPDTNKININDIELLLEDYQSLESVELAQIDVAWLEKLFSIIDLAKHLAVGISLFLIFAVLILIGNTIKGLGQSFQEEIVISKLVGATDAFVRRIFLYTGLFYGLIGSIFSLLFVFTAILSIKPHINELSVLYSSDFNIISLSYGDIIALIAIGIILGLGGAWVAANRIISNISL